MCDLHRWLNFDLYGSEVHSGYGDTTALFDGARPVNIAHYFAWCCDAGPMVSLPDCGRHAPWAAR